VSFSVSSSDRLGLVAHPASPYRPIHVEPLLLSLATLLEGAAPDSDDPLQRVLSQARALPRGALLSALAELLTQTEPTERYVSYIHAHFRLALLTHFISPINLERSDRRLHPDRNTSRKL
jgi:hypothetical protein